MSEAAPENGAARPALAPRPPPTSGVAPEPDQVPRVPGRSPRCGQAASSAPERTAGDEFQGVLADADDVVGVVVLLWCGTAAGASASGPAPCRHRCRAQHTGRHRAGVPQRPSGGRRRQAAADVRLAVRGAVPADAGDAQAVLSALAVVVERRSEPPGRRSPSSTGAAPRRRPLPSSASRGRRSGSGSRSASGTSNATCGRRPRACSPGRPDERRDAGPAGLHGGRGPGPQRAGSGLIAGGAVLLTVLLGAAGILGWATERRASAGIEEGAAVAAVFAAVLPGDRWPRRCSDGPIRRLPASRAARRTRRCCAGALDRLSRARRGRRHGAGRLGRGAGGRPAVKGAPAVRGAQAPARRRTLHHRDAGQRAVGRGLRRVAISCCRLVVLVGQPIRCRPDLRVCSDAGAREVPVRPDRGGPREPGRRTATTLSGGARRRDRRRPAGQGGHLAPRPQRRRRPRARRRRPDRPRRGRQRQRRRADRCGRRRQRAVGRLERPGAGRPGRAHRPGHHRRGGRQRPAGQHHRPVRRHGRHRGRRPRRRHRGEARPSATPLSGDLLDVDVDLAADLDLAAPIAGAVAANANVAAPIDAAVAANVGSIDPDASPSPSRTRSSPRTSTRTRRRPPTSSPTSPSER